MTITINIDTELEAALEQQAHAAGLTIEQFARQILEREDGRAGKHHPRIEASLRTIESLRGILGPVPANALASELLYGER